MRGIGERAKKARWVFLIIALVIALPWICLGLKVIYLVSMLSLVGIYAIAVMGLDLGLGFGGQVNLGLQGFMAIGAYTVAILTTKSWVPPILSQPLVAAITGVLASLIIALIVSAPILRTIEKVPFALAAIAFGLTVYFVVSGATFTGATLGITGVPAFSVGPLELRNSTGMYYLVWAVVFSLLFFSVYVVRSQWGLACRSICSDDRTAEALGVNVRKYRLEVFLLSSVFAGIAGVLLAFQMRGVDPTYFTFWTMLLFLFALYFGGARTIWGAIIGTVIIFLIIPESVDLVSRTLPWVSNVTELIEGIIFILILFFLPGGLFSLIRKRA